MCLPKAPQIAPVQPTPPAPTPLAPESPADQLSARQAVNARRSLRIDLSNTGGAGSGLSIPQ